MTHPVALVVDKNRLECQLQGRWLSETRLLAEPAVLAEW